MNRLFIVSEETKTDILYFTKEWTNEFPGVIVQITRRTQGYLINIEGPEEKTLQFISKLNDNGVLIGV